MTPRFDTSGSVPHPRWVQSNGAPVPIGWQNLPPFVQGAMDEALFTTERFDQLTGRALMRFLALSRGVSEKIRERQLAGRAAYWNAPVRLKRHLGIIDVEHE